MPNDMPARAVLAVAAARATVITVTVSIFFILAKFDELFTGLFIARNSLEVAHLQALAPGWAANE